MTQGEAGAGAVQAPLVDRSALDPIMKVTGAAVMRRIIDAFWSEADNMTGALDDAIESGEQDSIRKAAHALKGAASNVGAGRTARIAATLEKADQAQARALMPLLRQALDETRPALEDVLRDAA